MDIKTELLNAYKKGRSDFAKTIIDIFDDKFITNNLTMAKFYIIEFCHKHIIEEEEEQC